MYPPILRVHLKQRSVKDLSNDAYAMLLCFLIVYVVDTQFELHQQVEQVK